MAVVLSDLLADFHIQIKVIVEEDDLLRWVLRGYIS